LQAEFDSLDPVQLLNEIQALQRALQAEGHRPVESPTSEVQTTSSLEPAANQAKKPRHQKTQRNDRQPSNKPTALKAVWQRFLDSPRGAQFSRHDLADLGKEATISQAICELVRQQLIEKSSWGKYTRFSGTAAELNTNDAGLIATLRDYFVKNEGRSVTFKELLRFGSVSALRSALMKLKAAGFIEGSAWATYRR
jgi:hypothetical protein